MTAPCGGAGVASDGDLIQVVAFRVGGHEFAADVFHVQRVLRYELPTPVRNAPPYHEGVIQVRGAALPVIDLRKRFALADAPVCDETRIMMVEADEGSGAVGLVVDAASGVLRVRADAVGPPPPVVHGLAAEYVQGIIRLPERSLVLLRTARLLHSTERIVLEQSGGEAHG